MKKMLINNDIVHIVLLILMFTVDGTINSVCLALQWSFAENIYSLLCKKCDKIVTGH